MPPDTISVPVPQALYIRLERLARLSGRSLENLVASTLESNLPPLPDDLPFETQQSLRAMEQASDSDLWTMLHSKVPSAELDQYEELRERKRIGQFSRDDELTLEQLKNSFDRLTLQKAYAAVILKWRGHRIPTLAEMEV